MFNIFRSIVTFLILFLIGCNSNLTKEEKKALWDKAQTEGEIVRRSGTPYNIDTHRELALSDAENRLISGGGLFGKKNLLSFGEREEVESSNTSSFVGLPINQYLWKASIETINFMPMSSIDPMSGTLITDWYTSESNIGERCKLNIFINGKDLKTDNLKVLSFCQKIIEGQWVNIESDKKTNTKLENTILNKAKKIRLGSG